MNQSLDAAPLVEYVESVRDKTEGNLTTLAEFFGVSVRNFSRYLTLGDDGHIVAKTPAIPLCFADEVLSHVGDETLHTLWDFAALNVTVNPNHPKCTRCNFELIKPRKLCGFCVEETTGRTLTFRERGLY